MEDSPLVSKQRIVVEEDSMDSIAANDLRTEGDSTMAEIFLTNLPHDCSDHELREWVESRGIEVKSTRIILDLETGVAPAFGYVEIENADFVKAGAASSERTKIAIEHVSWQSRFRSCRATSIDRRSARSSSTKNGNPRSFVHHCLPDEASGNRGITATSAYRNRESPPRLQSNPRSGPSPLQQPQFFESCRPSRT